MRVRLLYNNITKIVIMLSNKFRIKIKKLKILKTMNNLINKAVKRTNKDT